MVTRREPPRPRRRLGRYDIVRVIGLSATAEVVEGRAPDARVAIKRLLPHAHEDPELRARFADEITRTLAQSDPAVVRGLEVIEAPGTQAPCLVMPYLDGVTLAAHLSRQELRPANAPALRHAACALARCLSPLHDHPEGPLAHGDISAKNVIIDPTGHVTLLDLGTLSPHGADQRDLGTPRYLCPDRRRTGRVTTQGDIYGVGVLLWEMATGQRWPMTHPQPPLPTPLSTTALGQLIQRCLASDPEARPANAAQLTQALDACASPEDRHAWRRWTDPQLSGASDALTGATAWVALIVALSIATTTALWFINQMIGQAD